MSPRERRQSVKFPSDDLDAILKINAGNVESEGIAGEKCHVSEKIAPCSRLSVPRLKVWETKCLTVEGCCDPMQDSAP